MTYVSRAGRKAMMKRHLKKHFSKGYKGGMQVGGLARKMGVKSSTELKKMLMEMVAEDDEIMYRDSENGRFWYYRPYVQLRLVAFKHNHFGKEVQ